MAQYIAASDIDDKILSCTEADISAANEYIERAAKLRGVSTISSPTSYAVKRLGVCYACYKRAIACTGEDSSATFGNGETSDIYFAKMRAYKDELKSLEESLTASDFSGGNQPTGVNIVLGRA